MSVRRARLQRCPRRPEEGQARGRAEQASERVMTGFPDLDPAHHLVGLCTTRPAMAMTMLLVSQMRRG